MNEVLSAPQEDQLRWPTESTVTEDEADSREEGGPLGWFRPLMLSSHRPLGARAAKPDEIIAAESALPEGPVPEAAVPAAAPVNRSLWRDALIAYRQRKSFAAAIPAFDAAAPAIAGAVNWLPLGPTVVLDGQTVGDQPVAGRIVGIAVAPGGQLMFAASANGGVFRSDDGGTSWRSMMDGFDLDPTNFASASLVCGAIAMSPTDPARIYVGTGEGETHGMFLHRVTDALPAYRGVGPVISLDGGSTWQPEPSQPDLAGEAFYALAVDPADGETVVAATTGGLYQRTVAGAGGPQWVRREAGIYTSVVAVRTAGGTQFFAALWGGPVRSSSDGVTWNTAGTGFPTSDVSRVTLAIEGTTLYALAATDGGAVHGLFRLDGLAGPWQPVGDIPDFLPGGQGDYDLALALSPGDPDVVYLGGDRGTAPPWPASVWRCTVAKQNGAYVVADAASIGERAHADVHVLVHTPGDADELWCGCDGGVFLNRDPRGSGGFASQNSGLACLCCNFIGQHPTDPSVLFTGLQDNGTAYTASGPVWKHVWGGDGGYCLVNWNDPKLVIVFANGKLYRSTTGGSSHASWSKVWNFPWATMTEPIATTPYDPQHPAEAGWVAVGTGQQVILSQNFADSWSGGFTIPASAGSIFALAFASSRRLFAATTLGQVFRADRGASGWAAHRIDDAAAGPLGLAGLITDVAIDWADADQKSIYVAFAGMGDPRRVWHYDGVHWEARSGAPGSELLNVEHNALAVDARAPQNVYAGADIGVWHSPDGGHTWQPFQNGLPDVPVFDLQIHPTQRLLRVATHGRGVYEVPL